MSRRLPRRTLAIVVALVIGIGSASQAQIRRGGRQFGGFYGRPMRFATAEDFDGSFQFCRVVFSEAQNGDGGGWNVDYPRADENLSIRLSELTTTSVGMDSENV